MATDNKKNTETNEAVPFNVAGREEPDEPALQGPATVNADHHTKNLESRLSVDAINAWRISGSIGSLVYWIIPIVYGAVSTGNSALPEWPAYLLGIFFLIYTIMEATVIPYIRWNRWSYRVDQHEIDLQRGLFVISRTLIPVKRVQHVDTRQGPVYRQFGLATVTITTAGDVHEIPALSESVADDLRNKISEYARVAREDL